MGAAACMGIEQIAGHPGVVYFSRGGIPQLFETTAAAPVAQGLPLFGAELIQSFALPEMFHTFALNDG